MTKQNVRVIIRFRPVNKREKKEAKEQKIDDKPPLFKNDDNQDVAALEIHSNKSATPHQFTFDRVLASKVSQKDVFYYVAQPVCDDVLDGYNGCIFAYGQTGSGKTYTMVGPEGQNGDPQHMGIIPRSVSYIFAEIEQDEEIMEARIKVSFVEIYKEKLRDLLNPSSKKNLAVRLGENGQSRISNVTETYVLTLLDVLQLMEVANSYRTKAETSMNHSSSRSHMLMQLTVALRVEDGSIRVGKLNFCDLAGSEKVRKTKATGERLKEAQQINLSLTILGQVISALSKSAKHVPFRDSKLTHVLKDSLGGNCKTTLVVNCSKHMFNRDETINALRFGSRCKLIANNVTVNRIYSNAELMAMVDKLQRENGQLQQMLKEKGFASDLLASPKGNKLFDRKNGGKKKGGGVMVSDEDREKQSKLLQQVETLKKQMSKMDDKQHYLQLQNQKVEEQRHDLSEQMALKEKQVASLSARINDYQARTHEQQQLVYGLEHEKTQQQLKIQSLTQLNDEYVKKIKDISKDRQFRTTKLNDQLSKFKTLHKDAKDESTELMDEILNLKQSLEKSEAIIDAQDNQLLQQRKDMDAVHKQLSDAESRVALVFKDKTAVQTQLDSWKERASQYQTEVQELKEKMEKVSDSKDNEINQLKEKLEERTQMLTEKNFELTQKLEQREMIQHALSIRSAQSNEMVSPSPKANTAMLNASATSGSYQAPKIVPMLSTKASFHHLFAPGGNNDEISPELLIKSASMNSMQDVINSEQSILAQHDYLKRMETGRLGGRQLTEAYTKRRSHFVHKFDPMSADADKKKLETELQAKQSKVSALRNSAMPSDKEQRLKVLLEIAAMEDDITQLQRKLQRIEKKQKHKGKVNHHQQSSSIVSKMSTVDAMDYIDAALTMRQVHNEDDNDDDE
mmetsp:Transcript_52228/g.86420  ORF Transcript_52228/g.86420 Transcript_52228/m.86420 type:complete len:908 (+) Transcript_52228:109-2832(+)|eukprot:CAMPEP_0202717284 /NCGR_PEP_ID=MMETSP1385-20130828/110202_1 /ASSEMBLY_ACC=CAM_ASM_000861 /TAXON_ID=933848 /ORGANISM="Elphidium margaritaceum" /LENGTH=907 /DNA_ID=CAMNT_0049379445 /DNA_START=45 /DNA_END=2768 /DNA_ORIENTATION=-